MENCNENVPREKRLMEAFCFSQQILATPEHYFIAKWIGVTEKSFLSTVIYNINNISFWKFLDCSQA